MRHQGKVFGVGLSKTGTTTLGECFEILGLQPHAGHKRRLKAIMRRGGDREAILTEAERYRSFEDSPWYHLYRELDQRFPSSKFILTTRVDSGTHARSAWNMLVRKGQRRGEISPEVRKRNQQHYEAHNAAVRDYFRDRPDDFLEVCWERGDGWGRLCNFLGVPVPDVPFPHRNAGQGRNDGPAMKAVRGSYAFMMLLRARRHVRRSRKQLGRYLAGLRSR